MRRHPRLEGRLPLIALACVIAIAAAITLWETRGQSLYADEVSLFARYRDWDAGTLFRSQSGHLYVIPVVAYKTLWELFGADSMLPFRINHVALASLTAVLFYLLARRSLGPWGAIGPTALLLFLGSGSEVTATPFGWLAYIAIAPGLGTFIALEREDRKGDIAAALMLAVGLASYSVMLAFVAGAATMIWWRGPGRRLASAWVVAAPLLAYLAWRTLDVSGGETNVSSESVANLPSSMFALAAAATSSLTGLFREPGAGGFSIEWGYPVAIVLAVLAFLRIRSGPSPGPRFWVYLVTLTVFWALVAVNLGPLRSPDASRYQYIGVMLLILAGAELLPPLRLRSPLTLGLAAVLGLSLLANGVTLHRSAAGFRQIGDTQRGVLAAIEIAEPGADLSRPAFDLPSLPVTVDLIFPASDYLDAVDRWGSPAYTEDELLAANRVPREAADQQFARLLGVATVPASRPSPGSIVAATAAISSGRASSHRGCTVVTPAGDAVALTLELPSPGIWARSSRSPVSLGLRRFGDSFNVALRGVAAGGSADLLIPPDRSRRPWVISVSSLSEVELCAHG